MYASKKQNILYKRRTRSLTDIQTHKHNCEIYKHDNFLSTFFDVLKTY